MVDRMWILFVLSVAFAVYFMSTYYPEHYPQKVEHAPLDCGDHAFIGEDGKCHVPPVPPAPAPSEFEVDKPCPEDSIETTEDKCMMTGDTEAGGRVFSTIDPAGRNR